MTPPSSGGGSCVSIAEDIVDSLKEAGVELLGTYPCAKIRQLYRLVHANFRCVALSKEEEGVGVCAGAALAGVKPGMLIQSTGLGNMFNALCSLTITYRLPLLVLASWRGVYRETIPAQVPLGKRLPRILKAAGIKFDVVKRPRDLPVIAQAATEVYRKERLRVILLSPELWEEKEELPEEEEIPLETPLTSIRNEEGGGAITRRMTRLEVLQAASDFLEGKLVICNIGLPSRELYQVKHQPSNFYMLGSLGLASSIGLGVAMFTQRRVVVIDGDGSLLANLGTLATIAQEQPKNLTLIVVDNGVHGSTGNQPTAASRWVDLSGTARGLGIKKTYRVAERDKLINLLSQLGDGPNFVHVLARPGNAPVPTIPLTPEQIKQAFMQEVRSTLRK